MNASLMATRITNASASSGRERAPDLKRLFLLLPIIASMTGCSVFKPRIPRPEWDGSFQSALTAVDDTQKEVDRRLSSIEGIQAYSGLGTLVGAGGAGIAAVFKGSKDLILGFTTLGAVSLAVNGSYGNRPQLAIYRNASAAFSCLQDSIAPVATAHRSIGSTLEIVEDRADAVQERLKVTTGLMDQQTVARQLLSQAQWVGTKQRLRVAIEDGYASAVISALRSLVTKVNEQLDTAIPDAVALSRTGSSLMSFTVKGEKEPLPPANEWRDSNYRPAEVDTELRDRMNELRASINQAAKLMHDDVKTPSIDCNVADASTIAPMRVTSQVD